MTKTLLMGLGLAGVFAAGTACFGLFTPRSEQPAGESVEACAGLSDEAKADCERRHGR
jgi:hypothetical protein